MRFLVAQELQPTFDQWDFRKFKSCCLKKKKKTSKETAYKDGEKYLLAINLTVSGIQIYMLDIDTEIDGL